MRRRCGQLTTFDDLPSFLKIYYEGMNVLVHEPDFYDLTFAYFTKVHSQNVCYVEMFFDPQPHTGRGVPFDVIIRGIRRAQLEAERMLGIKSQLILCFLARLERRIRHDHAGTGAAVS